jgi:formamidopyrimidine-DNA glycosylase
MPELPEVETVVRELRRYLPGRSVQRVVCRYSGAVSTGAEAFQQALRGRTFSGVGRHGKYLFLSLSGEREVALHLRMTGQMLLLPRRQPLDGHCHLEILLAGSDRKLVFRDVRKFGRLELLSGRRADFIRDRRLGPDALNICAERLYDSLRRTRRCLKAALLDQRLLAGMGNIYTDEVLFRERLSPLLRSDSLSLRRVRSLAAAIRTVLRAALRRRGTSIQDYVDPGGRRGGYQFVLQAYGREGEACPRCGRAIVRTVVAGRGTWTCPRCQREPASGGAPHWTARGNGATVGEG